MADSQPERYRLERKISSKGSFGEVWLATDTLLDRPVAIKCPKVAHDPIRRERFLTEARMLARLNHPNITQIHDALFDEGKDRFYLVVEYVDGQDLAEIIEGGTPLPLDIVLDVAMGILRALSYVHGQGVVHRDVKPANVMIADDVKLTDFGLANLKSILQRGAGFMAGTAAYLAPEQIEGRTIDGRADLYALGVTLFEMISGGHLPFDCADEVEMLKAHLNAAPTPLSTFAPTIPPVLEQAIMRLLAKDPEDRYPSAQALMDVLVSIHIGPKLSNLPIQITPFVGREAMLAEIAERLGDPACRLLTLVGPGGSGKTRLALEAAATQIDDFAHGVFFVSLAPLQSVEAIVPTVAQALSFSFHEEGEPQQQLLDYLSQKTMLLIMDNFEHLLDGVGLVTEILKTAPDAKILTTSRARLNLQGEHLFPIAGMHFPDREIAEDTTRYSAVKLFLSSARRTQPSFEPTADNLTDVVQICRLVEGMPLGIELAAGLVQMLTPAEIATEISQSLDVLETDLRDVPKRQRSIRAVSDHSWNLLTEREREVFQGLSVFRGGFTRQAAGQVTGASLRELMALVHKSLLQRTPAPSATLRTGGRYEVHELLRQYAAEKLDQLPAASEAARDQHCAYYAAALQEWDADLKGARQQTALAEMDVEIENTRTAWNWAVEQGQVERLDQAIDGLCRFYEWRVRYQEGEAACRMAARKLASEKLAATASGEGLRIWAKILTWQSVFSRVLGCTEPASQLLRQSLPLLEKPELAGPDTRLEKAFVLAEMGYIAVVSGNREEAGRLYEQSLALYQALGDRYGMALALYALGEVAQHLGVYDQAKQWYEESLAIRQALGDRRGIADSLSSLGWVANFQGRTQEGERLARGSIAIRRELGGQVGIARGLYDLSASLMEFGRYAEARSLLEESVAIFNNLGFREGLARSWSALGFAKAHLGQYEQARAQALMALTLAREINYQQVIACSLCWLGCAAGAMGAYAEAQQLLQESVALFREIGQREELGWSLSALGSMKLALGNFLQAWQHFYEALQIAAEIRSFITLLAVLPPIALMLLVQGEKERAVKLYALASRYPAVANSRLFKDVAGRYIASLPREVKERAVELYALASRYPAVANSRLFEDVFGRLIGAVAATLPPDVVAAAQARGRARDLEATVAELLVELAG